MSPTSSNVPFVVTLLPPPFSYLYRRRRSRSQPINTAGSWSPSSSSSSRPTLSLLGRAFLNFGLHISKHQIRVLLICCLVITLLAYPALAIHYRTVFASRSAAGADLSGMEAGDVPEGFSWGELQSGAFGWEGEGWEVSSVDERAAEAWGGSGRVRMERIWIAERDPTLSSSSSSPSPSKELLNATAFACALREAVPDELNLLACYPRINVPPLDDDPVRGARAAWNCYLREEMGSYAPFISSWDEDAWQNAIKQALIGTNAEVWGRFSGRQTVYHVRVSGRYALVSSSSPINAEVFACLLPGSECSVAPQRTRLANYRSPHDDVSSTSLPSSRCPSQSSFSTARSSAGHFSPSGLSLKSIVGSEFRLPTSPNSPAVLCVTCPFLCDKRLFIEAPD